MKRIVGYFYQAKVKSKQEILTEFVEEMVKINNTIRHINYGGCGIFAEHLYDNLILLGFKPKIAVFVYSVVEFEKSINILKTEGMVSYYYKRTEGFPHIIVTLDDLFIDSTGAFTDYKQMHSYWPDYKLYKDFDIDILRECNSNDRLWNSSFNRNNITSIYRKLNKIYKKISRKYLVETE